MSQAAHILKVLEFPQQNVKNVILLGSEQPRNIFLKVNNTKSLF